MTEQSNINTQEQDKKAHTPFRFVKGLFVKGLLGASAIVLILLVAHVFGRVQQLSQPLPINETQTMQILPGMTITSVLNELAERQLFSDQLAAKLYLKFKPELANIQSGTFDIPPNVSFIELLNILAFGKSKAYRITLIEGLRWQDWLSQLKQDPTVSFDMQGDTSSQVKIKLESAPEQHFEGLFLADTYQYQTKATASSILQRAHNALYEYLTSAWQKRALDLPYETQYQALIMASIIEKETAQAQERPLIAGVFVNRLRKNMRLQTDPTVIYGMGDAFDGDIRRKDLKTPTPYNTYVIKGLPPTPIAMPGREAIDAALHPADTEALYFVAKGDGSHQFSNTLAEHNAAVRQYQLKKSK